MRFYIASGQNGLGFSLHQDGEDVDIMVHAKDREPEVVAYFAGETGKLELIRGLEAAIGLPLSRPHKTIEVSG